MTNFFRMLDEQYVSGDKNKALEKREKRVVHQDCPMALEKIVDDWMLRVINYQEQ